MTGALSGLRVVDLTRALAGPLCAQTLADLGAEVIKIERPGSGDESRGWGPPWITDPGVDEAGESAYFASTNRGKYSVTVDIGGGEGQEIVRRLATNADVFIENFKTGSLAAKGLGYPTLAALNPRLVYCSITAFGQTGPRREEAGYDYVIQGMSGLMSLTGNPDGDPQRSGVAIADLTTGLHATIAILAALRHRDATGEGQHLDAALFDTTLSLLASYAVGYLKSGKNPSRTGSAHGSIAPYQHFQTGDGRLVIAALNDGQFRRLAGVLGRPALADEARFRTNKDRVRNQRELASAMESALSTRGAKEWAELLRDADVPSGPINSVSQALADPTVAARGLTVDVPRAQGASVPAIAYPVKLSTTPAAYAKAPPRLGEDTDAVLGRVLGFDAATLEGLHARGTV